jgi:uracil-DNA glycosylase
MEVRIESSWKEHLKDEFESEWFKELAAFVKTEYQSEVVYPAPKHIFRAFDLCPFEDVKVVILGQDPYHGPKQANGLCFAVEEGMPLPPSLQNIFKEIEKEYGEPMKNRSGDLERWAKQGVLLLNATLTVRARMASSHQGKGWEQLTDAAVKALSENRENLVFMLWGNYARAKKALIDASKHCILESPHPSPFSAHSGFFGNNHFKQANAYLKKSTKEQVDWLG